MDIRKAAYVAGGTLFAARLALRLRPRFRLKGAVVVVTGGSRGLGLGMAREFGERGARVAICGRDEEHLGRAEGSLREQGFDVFAHRCNVGVRAEVDAFIEAVKRRYGRVDVLVNNAGTMNFGPVTTMVEDDYRAAMDTHFWGAYYAVEAVLPGMRQARTGRIVNIASIGGLVSVPHLVPYTASKFALVGYSEGLHAELARFGIAVTTICPGLMRTGSPRNAFFKGNNAKEYAAFILLGTSPISSMNAVRAARRIVKACERGEARVVLSYPAWGLAFVHALFPNTMQAVFTLANGLLPKEGGIGEASLTGSESATAVTESPLTALGKKAERTFNQLP